MDKVRILFLECYSQEWQTYEKVRFLFPERYPTNYQIYEKVRYLFPERYHQTNRYMDRSDIHSLNGTHQIDRYMNRSDIYSYMARHTTWSHSRHASAHNHPDLRQESVFLLSSLVRLASMNMSYFSHLLIVKKCAKQPVIMNLNKVPYSSFKYNLFYYSCKN